MIDQARRAAISERRQNILDGRFGGEFDRCVGEAEPLGPETDLGRRFLARI